MSENMRKVVINTCFGGFSVSLAAAEHMAANGCPIARAEVEEYRAKLADASKQDRLERKYGVSFYGYGYTEDGDGYPRDSSQLVAAVEALGEAAGGSCSKLRVVEIPSDIQWRIEEYDGSEHIAEEHRTWA